MIALLRKANLTFAVALLGIGGGILGVTLSAQAEEPAAPTPPEAEALTASPATAAELEVTDLAQAELGFSGDRLLPPAAETDQDLSSLEFRPEAETAAEPSLEFRRAADGSLIVDMQRQAAAQSGPSSTGEIPADNLAERPAHADVLTPELPPPAIDNSGSITPQPLEVNPIPSEDGEPRIEVYPVGEPRIPADDRSTIAIAGQILDPDGNVLDQDLVVTLTASAGEFVGADYDTDKVGFQVLARRGEFEARLKSNLAAQQVRIRAAADGRKVRGIESGAATPELYPELEAYTSVEFMTYLRPSLVAGVVDVRLGPGGSDMWDSFREYLNPDYIGRTDFDVDAAVFATGALGEWLVTGAFNSDRALNERCDGNRLYRDVQFCEQTYPTYGDSSRTDFLTPSIDSFYLRLQRDSDVAGAEPDYIMWGDYNTLEFARASQEFTSTIRQLHGFKGNYTFGGLQLTAMYGNNLRPFQRDTLVPDGTSGYYFLSQRLVLPGSENVFIELEELNRPGTVIERQALTRGIDYEIDYDRGTLLFRRPILATELNPLGVTLVRRIVTTYQVDSNTGGDLFAGRLQYTFDRSIDSPNWIGATIVTQDEGLRDFTLVGGDLIFPLGENGRVIGEFANSSLTTPSIDQNGNAYRLEASGSVFENVFARAYLRSADDGFRNDATTSYRPGQTRWGAAVNAAVGPDTTVRAAFDQETNSGVTPQVLTTAAALLAPTQDPVPGPEVDNTLNTYNLGIEQRWGTATLGLDWVNRTRNDRVRNTYTNAHQIVPRFALPIGANLTFQAQSEINLTSDVDVLYPSRTTFGVDWAVDDDTTVRLAQQFISGGGGQQPGSITSLDVLTAYSLGENTSFTSRYSILGGINGITGEGAIGLNHRIPIAPGLRANFTLERIFGDAFNRTGSGQQYAQPYAVGTAATSLGLSSGTSYSVGLEYTPNPDFQASGRFEHRDSSGGSNNLFSLAAAGKINPALTTLFRYQQANYANQLITGRLGDTINLKLGMAYRNPVSDQFNGLLSYEFRQNPATTPDSILGGFANTSSDHTLALEGIYAPNWQWEFYGKYAFRLNDVNVADDLSVSSTIHLAQFRAAYRFAYQWDVLGEVRWIGQPSTNYSELGLALELGYYLTPDLRIGAGYSFGSANDTSFAGSGYRSASGPYIGVTLKVNELLNGFGLQEVSPPQQEESLVESAATPSPDAPAAAPDEPTSETTSPAPAEAAAVSNAGTQTAEEWH